MAESVFQSIRGAQFRGSRFPGFRSTGQQADSGVDPATAALASENAQSWTGPRASTALNAQSFGGSDFSASTAPAGAPAPDGGPNLAGVGQTISNTVQSALPDFTTTGGIIGTAGRIGGVLAGGGLGAGISAVGRGIGELIDAENYNNDLRERGSAPISPTTAAVNAVAGGLTFNALNDPDKTARGQRETSLEQTRETTRAGALSGVARQGNSDEQNNSESIEDTGSLFGGQQGPSEAPATGPASDPFSGGDPYGGNDPNGGGGSTGGGVGGASDGSNDSGGTGFAKGGHVTADRLKGPNPPGPDDGYAALDVGETVITAEATRRYGKDVMMALNKGLVSPEAVRRLLG
jgi:hypothetical protein